MSPNGLVTGLVKGASEIRATAEDVTGTMVIMVAVAPRPVDVTAGNAMNRRLADMGRPIPWTSKR